VKHPFNQKGDAARDDMAVDGDGNSLPYTGPEVRDIVLKMVDEGEIMAVILRKGEQLGVQVFGPPSKELLDILETTTRAYRRALRGH
jgi:hypothetical protein